MICGPDGVADLDALHRRGTVRRRYDLRQACAIGLEGVVSKRLTGPTAQGRRQSDDLGARCRSFARRIARPHAELVDVAKVTARSAGRSKPPSAASRRINSARSP